jgi:hypothetical protein
MADKRRFELFAQFITSRFEAPPKRRREES